MDYNNETIDLKVHISEKRTDKDIFRYEYHKSKNGWWITKEHYNVENSFPQRVEIWIPDEVIDHITSFNAKEKLS